MTSTQLRASTSPEIYFSPQDQVAEKLIALIDQEPKSICAAVYCLMSGEISQALQRAKKRGVSVEVIVDPFSVKQRSPIRKMDEKGITVHVWDPQMEEVQVSKYAKKPLMHDKFCVFGDHTVWTGSFNFTRQASRSNKENVVVLHDPAIAALYLAEFQKIKKEGCSAYRQFLAMKEQKRGIAVR
jgi:phosphatidylserine/phosphatidylglycerophosphate/cardiolipin synthase-like enzyme